jgi:hypothetical protein
MIHGRAGAIVIGINGHSNPKTSSLTVEYAFVRKQKSHSLPEMRFITSYHNTIHNQGGFRWQLEIQTNFLKGHSAKLHFCQTVSKQLNVHLYQQSSTTNLTL